MSPYTELYNTAKIRPKYLPICNLVGARIIKGRAAYEAVAAELANGIPWWFIGITHFMEAGHKYPEHFNYHLHCGDPLTGRTVHVPAGRPKHEPAAGDGNPYTWHESALDALSYMKYDKVSDWSKENILYLFEKFNGLGYKKRGINSPYLWSFTNHYISGKFVADGRFDPAVISKQPGTAAIMKALNV